MVCPACGKFFDISARAPGSRFDCYCGRELHVPTEPPRPVLRGTRTTLRLTELRRRNRVAIVALTVGFIACIGLLSACVYLLVQERRWTPGTCAGLMALAFLAVAVIATSEYRLTKSEIAGETAEGEGEAKG